MYDSGDGGRGREKRERLRTEKEKMRKRWKLSSRRNVPRTHGENTWIVQRRNAPTLALIVGHAVVKQRQWRTSAMHPSVYKHTRTHSFAAIHERFCRHREIILPALNKNMARVCVVVKKVIATAERTGSLSRSDVAPSTGITWWSAK